MAFWEESKEIFGYVEQLCELNHGHAGNATSLNRRARPRRGSAEPARLVMKGYFWSICTYILKIAPFLSDGDLLLFSFFETIFKNDWKSYTKLKIRPDHISVTEDAHLVERCILCGGGLLMGCIDPYEPPTHSPQHDRAPWGGSSSTPTIIIQSVFQSSYNLNLETYFCLINHSIKLLCSIQSYSRLWLENPH